MPNVYFIWQSVENNYYTHIAQSHSLPYGHIHRCGTHATCLCGMIGVWHSLRIDGDCSFKSEPHYIGGRQNALCLKQQNYRGMSRSLLFYCNQQRAIRYVWFVYLIIFCFHKILVTITISTLLRICNDFKNSY